jgi:hypothetical protein
MTIRNNFIELQAIVVAPLLVHGNIQKTQIFKNIDYRIIASDVTKQWNQ